jgi:hypothetical protein
MPCDGGAGSGLGSGAALIEGVRPRSARHACSFVPDPSRRLRSLNASGRRMCLTRRRPFSTALARVRSRDKETAVKFILWTALVFCSLAGGELVTAAATDAPGHDRPASPRSLPGDNLPPFGMLGDHGKLVPTPPLSALKLHRGPGFPPESTAEGPSLSLAHRSPGRVMCRGGSANPWIATSVARAALMRLPHMDDAPARTPTRLKILARADQREQPHFEPERPARAAP